MIIKLLGLAHTTDITTDTTQYRNDIIAYVNNVNQTIRKIAVVIFVLSLCSYRYVAIKSLCPDVHTDDITT